MTSVETARVIHNDEARYVAPGGLRESSRIAAVRCEPGAQAPGSCEGKGPMVA
jgi:hypothetical protein